jgi:hypothetical protein
MVLWQNNAEAGSAGAAVTTANSDGSGEAFSIVSTSGDGTVSYSSAQAAFGTQSYLFHASPADGIALARWSQTDATHRFRAYFRLGALPTGTVNLVQLRSDTVSTGATIQVTSAGVIQTSSNGVANPLISNATANTWYMISMKVTKGTTTNDGYVKAEIRNLAGSSVLGSFETSTANTGTGDLTYVQFGKLTNSNAELTAYFDQVAFDVGDSALIGPSTSAPVLSIAQAPYYVVNASGSAAGAGGTLTYTAAWVSGPVLTVTQPTPGRLYFTQSTTASSVYTITVSESGGGSDDSNITIPLASSSTQIVNNGAPLRAAGSVPGNTWS